MLLRRSSLGTEGRDRQLKIEVYFLTNSARPLVSMIALNERVFVKKALLEGTRVDRRRLDDHRELHFEFGAERGHVIVHLGQTK